MSLSTEIWLGIYCANTVTKELIATGYSKKMFIESAAERESLYIIVLIFQAIAYLYALSWTQVLSCHIMVLSNVDCVFILAGSLKVSYTVIRAKLLPPKKSNVLQGTVLYRYCSSHIRDNRVLS